jgi:hypothetical protein
MTRVKIDDFSFGLVTDSDFSQNRMPYGTLTFIKNVEISTGRIQSPSRMDKVFTTPNKEPITALLTDNKNTGLFVATTRTLFYFKEGSFTALKDRAFSRRGRPHMVALDNKLFCCDGVSEPFVLDTDDVEANQYIPIKTEDTAWATNKPEYAIVHEGRLWVMLKDSNQFWHSVLRDASDYRISTAGAADSANFYDSGDTGNTIKSIIPGLNSLLIFKKRGMSLVKNLAPGTFDATQYRIFESYTDVTSYSPQTTAVVGNRVYTLGAFGLQEISVNDLTGSIQINQLAKPIARFLENTYLAEGMWSTLVARLDGKGLFFDYKRGAEVSVVSFNFEKDTIDEDVTFPEQRLLGYYTDFTKGRTVLASAYGNELWARKGSLGYPTALEFVVKLPYHMYANGSVYRGKQVRIGGHNYNNANLSFCWDNRALPDDTIPLFCYSEDESGYQEGAYAATQYGSGQIHPPQYNTVPMYGQGENTSLEFRLPNVHIGLTIREVTIDVQPVGVAMNG